MSKTIKDFKEDRLIVERKINCLLAELNNDYQFEELYVKIDRISVSDADNPYRQFVYASEITVRI